MNKTLTNAELRQAINDTVENLKPATNGFGHRYQILDDNTLTMLRGHLLELQQLESERAKTVVMAQPDDAGCWIDMPTAEHGVTKRYWVSK